MWKGMREKERQVWKNEPYLLLIERGKGMIKRKRKRKEIRRRKKNKERKQ